MIQVRIPGANIVRNIDADTIKLWPAVENFVTDDTLTLLLEDTDALIDLIEVSKAYSSNTNEDFKRFMSELKTEKIWNALQAYDYLAADWYVVIAHRYLASRCSSQNPDKVMQILHITDGNMLQGHAESVIRLLRPRVIFKKGFDEHCLYQTILDKQISPSSKTAHALIAAELPRLFAKYFGRNMHKFSHRQKSSLVQKIVDTNNIKFYIELCKNNCWLESGFIRRLYDEAKKQHHNKVAMFCLTSSSFWFRPCLDHDLIKNLNDEDISFLISKGSRITEDVLIHPEMSAEMALLFIKKGAVLDLSYSSSSNKSKLNDRQKVAVMLASSNRSVGKVYVDYHRQFPSTAGIDLPDE